MRFRLLVALFAVLGATAFAPAPFVKPDRNRDREEGDPLPRLQGTWSMTSKERMGPNGTVSKYSTTSQKLAIQDDSWSFVYVAKGGPKLPARPMYKLEIEPGGRPARFRVRRTTTDRDYMVGILTVEGDKAKMLYRLVTTRPQDDATPDNFDTIPEGWYRMTLERDPR
jgi:hypothetical protein